MFFMKTGRCLSRMLFKIFIEIIQIPIPHFQRNFLNAFLSFFQKRDGFLDPHPVKIREDRLPHILFKKAGEMALCTESLFLQILQVDIFSIVGMDIGQHGIDRRIV